MPFTKTCQSIAPTRLSNTPFYWSAPKSSSQHVVLAIDAAAAWSASAYCLCLAVQVDHMQHGLSVVADLTGGDAEMQRAVQEVSKPSAAWISLSTGMSCMAACMLRERVRMPEALA